MNNLRASLLHNLYQRNSFEMVLTTMLNKVMQKTPSYSEESHCTSCNYSQKRTIPIVGVKSDVYADNMINLEKAILENFPVEIICKCKHTLHTQRLFGEHIFVEVRYETFLLYRLQMNL